MGKKKNKRKMERIENKRAENLTKRYDCDKEKKEKTNQESKGTGVCMRFGRSFLFFFFKLFCPFCHLIFEIQNKLNKHTKPQWPCE